MALTLPTSKKPPLADIGRLNVLIYGTYKVGKTEFAAQFPDALFLSTEPGTNELEVAAVTINNWEELLEYAGLIAAGKHNYKTIVIDTIDNMYEMCRQYVLRGFKATYEGDVVNGKAWGAVVTEFNRVYTKLSQLEYGLITISHEDIIEFDTPVGKSKKIVPKVSKRVRDICMAVPDMLLYFTIQLVDKVPTRLIRTRPCATYEAGGRSKHIIDPIPMDYNRFVTEYAKAVQLRNIELANKSKIATELAEMPVERGSSEK